METVSITREVYKCRLSFPYFVDNYCSLLAEKGESGEWSAFHLWPEQIAVAKELQTNHLVMILKARQLGLTWLCVAFALWLMLFFPIATILLFSRRDDEAVDLLKNRLRGMYERLPEWLKARAVQVDNDHEFVLSNNSRAKAFPTSAGDSYTASFALVDEADLVSDLGRLMRAVKPTIDGGGRMVLLSRTNKTQPQSPFKRIYAGGKQRSTKWVSLFLPWNARPDRNQEWYDAQKADILHRTGSLDDLHEQYPASDLEALAPRTLDKRIAPQWLQQCYVEVAPLPLIGISKIPAIPGLVVYRLPEPGRAYVIGADPAEGNPTSDDSALEVLDKGTGEEVAMLAGKFQPSTLAAHADTIGQWYNNALLMVERNNHGHAVLLWLREHSRLWLLPGHDAQQGWLSNSKGKALLYDGVADAFRDRETTLHSFATYSQLSSIEGSTLRAPEGELDDLADAYALACKGRRVRTGPLTFEGTLICSGGAIGTVKPETFRIRGIDVTYTD